MISIPLSRSIERHFIPWTTLDWPEDWSRRFGRRAPLGLELGLVNVTLSGGEPLAAIWQRMLTHPAYKDAHGQCRMQDSLFRKQYIDAIPRGTPLPIEVWKNPHAFDPPPDGGFARSSRVGQNAFRIGALHRRPFGPLVRKKKKGSSD